MSKLKRALFYSLLSSSLAIMPISVFAGGMNSEKGMDTENDVKTEKTAIGENEDEDENGGLVPLKPSHEVEKTAMNGGENEDEDEVLDSDIHRTAIGNDDGVIDDEEDVNIERTSGRVRFGVYYGRPYRYRYQPYYYNYPYRSYYYRNYYYSPYYYRW